jgi:hypothetical protein
VQLRDTRVLRFESLHLLAQRDDRTAIGTASFID